MPLAQSTKTVADIATAVKRQFGDESGTQINDRDILRWINQGQTEIVRKGDVNKTTATTPSVLSQSEYSFNGVNIFKVFGVFYDNTPLDYVTFEQAKDSILINPVVAEELGDPAVWYEWDNSIHLYPTPQRSGDTIKLFVVVAPEKATTTTSVLSIPDTHFDALLQYVLQQAYELDDDFSSASVKGQQMAMTMEGLEGTSTAEPYTVVTVLPEDQ